MISGFHHEVDETCALLCYYAASSGNFLKMEPIGCPEMWVRNYHYLLRNNPEERSSHSKLDFTLYYLIKSCKYFQMIVMGLT